MKRTILTATILATALSLTACSTATAPAETTPMQTETATTIAPPILPDINNYIVSGEYGSAPEIEIKKLGNIEKLLVSDIKAGEGATATPADQVTVQYTGVGASSGKEFDSSWSNGGQPITFGLNQVIPGWTQGMDGMKEGGRRLLVIPASLAYGNQPPSPAIQSGETLVFVVDLIKVTKAP